MTYLGTIPYYVYKITCIPTGEFYWGSRYNHIKTNHQPEEDLWIRYYTSSDVIRALIVEYSKDQFQAEIVCVGLDRDSIFWLEQDFIRDSISDPRCLNGHYINRETTDKIFLTSGKSSWINNNGDRKFSIECPGPEWIQGSIHTGSKYWTKDGESNVFSKSCPGEGWTPAKRFHGTKWWHTLDGSLTRAQECPGPGWMIGSGGKLGGNKQTKSNGIRQRCPAAKSNQSKGKKKWTNQFGKVKFSGECPGTDWTPYRPHTKWIDADGNIESSTSRPGPEWTHISQGIKVWINPEGTRVRAHTCPGLEWILYHVSMSKSYATSSV